MVREYRRRIDGLFKALSDEDTRLEANEDIRALVGQIIVFPGENGEPELLLKGDLAGILSLVAGKKTPAHPEDERVLLTGDAGCAASVGGKVCSRHPHDAPTGTKSS